jgi:DNA-binding MarR family transcriptional regulator
VVRRWRDEPQAPPLVVSEISDGSNQVEQQQRHDGAEHPGDAGHWDQPKDAGFRGEVAELLLEPLRLTLIGAEELVRGKRPPTVAVSVRVEVVRRGSLRLHGTPQLYRGTTYTEIVTGAMTEEEYRRLLGVRRGLRRFLRWSEHQATAMGLTSLQHQLLLAVRAHADPRGPTIGDVAGDLLLRHNSAVELVDRAVAADLVRRRADPSDHRVVRLELTKSGRSRLEQLSSLHLEELKRLVADLSEISKGLEQPEKGEFEA